MYLLIVGVAGAITTLCHLKEEFRMERSCFSGRFTTDWKTMSRAFIWMYGCMMWFVGFVTSLLTYVKYMIDYAAFVNGSKMIVRSPIDDLDYKVTTALMLISLVFCIVFYHLYKRTTVHSE